MELLNELFIAALAALIAFGLAWIAQRYGIRDAELVSRIDEVCADIRRLEDRAIEYWELEMDSKLPSMELEILSLDHRVGALIEYISEDFWFFKDFSGDSLLDLRDAVTGGDFQVRGRPAEPGRRAIIGAKATDLILTLRRSRRSLLRGLF